MKLGVFFFTLLCIAGSAYTQNKLSLAEKHLDAALDHYQRKEYGLARSEVDFSINYEPLAEAYYLSGLLFEQEGKDLRAISEYEATIKKDVRYNEAYFQKGLIYLNYHNPEQAYKDFDFLINLGDQEETRTIFFEIDPQGSQQNSVMSLQSMKARLYSYRGQAGEKMGESEMALKDYNMAIELSPHPDYYLNRALLFYQQKKEEEAISDLKSAISLQPDHQLAWYNLLLIAPDTQLPDNIESDMLFAPTLGLFASKAYENGNNSAALTFYTQAIGKSEDALLLINRGRVLSRLERYEEARRDFNRAKYLEPSRAEAFYLVGNTYFFEMKYENAIAYYDQYLSIDPFHSITWYNAAMARLELKKTEEACHFLSKAKNLGMAGADLFIEQHCK